jgi:hypothetical protein
MIQAEGADECRTSIKVVPRARMEGVVEAASDSGAAQVAAPHDGSVIEGFRRGDENAFARLVDHYHGSLSRVTRLYICNRAVADEVVQDTCSA